MTVICHDCKTRQWEGQSSAMRSRGQGRVFERKGSKYLWCAYFLRGKEYRESTGETDPKKAEKFLTRRLKEVGADQIGKSTFIGPQQERIKVGKLLDALEADYQLRGKDSPQFRSRLKHIRSRFGAWRAIEMTAEAVDRYIVELQGTGYASATINRHTQLLAQAFKLAIVRRHLSTAPHIRHLSEKGNARQGFFSDAEFRLLITKLPNYLLDFVRFGYVTGWRKGEIASLRWEDVENDVIRLRAENTKNSEARSVTLYGELRGLIERRKEQRQVNTASGTALATYVFHKNGEPVGDFRKVWAMACVESDLGQFICENCKQTVSGRRCTDCKCEVRYVGRVFHDLRRTAIRNMVRARVPERVVMKISGHKTRSMLDRYNIVNDADIRNAIQLVEEHSRNAVGGQQHPSIMQMTVAGR